jgi:hypothetical protein
MKRSTYLTTLAVAVIFSLGLLCSQAWAKDRVYEMSGKISAIDLNYKTVVVEVPEKNGQILTVGGDLIPETVLRKGGKAAKLSDFKVGEQVLVKWKVTETGILILSLKAD